MSDKTIGIDIGGTRIKAVVVTAGGEVLVRRVMETGDAGDAYKATVAGLVSELEGRFGAAGGGVGVSSPGLARRDHRAIGWMRGRMAGVEGYEWGRHLAREVRVLNDAHAALTGEAWIGAAKGARDAVMFTLGTGVGGAIVCDGRLLRGHLGRAGHLGHLSLDPDGTRDIVNTPASIEDLIGDHSVRVRSGGRYGSTAELVAAHRAGDALASTVWLASVKALAATIAGVVNVVDPEVVVIGGGISKAGESLLTPLGQWMEQFEWRPTGVGVRIVTATLDEFAGAIGAARFAMTFEEGAAG